MRMDRSQPSDPSPSSSSSSSPVVAIECVFGGSSMAEEWRGDMLQTGDIVVEIRIGSSSPPATSPFKGGKSAVQKLLHAASRRGETSARVRVRRGRGEERVELQGCIVPHGTAGRKQQYALRSIHDPNYAVGFVDRTESECLALQGTRRSRVVTALGKAQLQEGYVSYAWDKKMRETLPIPSSSSFLSLLILPKASDAAATSYNPLEDTLARANSWLICSQASGVPIMFMNVQTEALLTKISGEKASSTVHTGSLSDLSNLANASLYGFEDYHGVDLGVVKAVRLWYTPAAGELAVDIRLREGDSKLGFSVSRTEEGFIFISSVIDGDDTAASTRSGLRDLYEEAARTSKLLVISRVSNEKVLPWMVSSSGAIRCFDTVSLSHKLSLYRHALQSFVIHVLMWDQPPPRTSSGESQRYEEAGTRYLPPSALPPPESLQNLTLGDTSDRLGKDTAGDVSFRFNDFSFSNSWV